MLPLCLALLVSACGHKSKMDAKDLVRECVLADDQKDTLQARWYSGPVPLASATSFSTGERESFESAAAQWNDFFSHTHGSSVFQVQGPSSQALGTPSDLCSKTIVYGGVFSGQVVVHKVNNWSNGNGVIALTSFCPSGSGNGYPAIYNAMIELNYKDYWASGKKQPDLNSILVHELGHLLGLDHSCTVSGGTSGFVQCNGAPQPYLSAVMYPTVLFNGLQGEQRRDLDGNTQGRANCLYGKQ